MVNLHLTASLLVYVPESSISKEDMLVIFYNILDMLGELPQGSSGKTMSNFGDSSKSSSYATNAMKFFFVQKCRNIAKL